MTLEQAAAALKHADEQLLRAEANEDAARVAFDEARGHTASARTAASRAAVQLCEIASPPRAAEAAQ